MFITMSCPSLQQHLPWGNRFIPKRKHWTGSFSFNIYIYINIYMCVCVCIVTSRISIWLAGKASPGATCFCSPGYPGWFFEANTEILEHGSVMNLRLCPATKLRAPWFPNGFGFRECIMWRKRLFSWTFIPFFVRNESNRSAATLLLAVMLK